MKPVIAACLLLAFIGLNAQTPNDLIHDVSNNLTSINQLRKVLEKQVQYEYPYELRDPFRDTTFFLKQAQLCRRFAYNQRVFNVRAIYKGEQPGYVIIEECYFARKQNDTLLKHVDTSFTNGILKTYNTEHKTDFTWQDLYEDKMNEFCIFPGLPLPAFIRDSTGAIIGLAEEPFISGNMMEFVPFIKKRDHAAIVKICKSFNPTRKAYGALCLVILQKLNEPLSTEEKQLINKISHSKETSAYSSGCLNYGNKKLSSFLTQKELNHMANVVIEDRRLNN